MPKTIFFVWNHFIFVSLSSGSTLIVVSTHQVLVFQLTLYKFVVLGFLSLSPIIFWAWEPNCVLTVIMRGEGGIWTIYVYIINIKKCHLNYRLLEACINWGGRLTLELWQNCDIRVLSVSYLLCSHLFWILWLVIFFFQKIKK